MTGTMSAPSSATKAAESGITAPFKMQLHTGLPKAVTVAVVVEKTTAKQAAGWPRNPGISKVVSKDSSFSVHLHPSSWTVGMRDVDSYPDVEIPCKSSAGSGASRSAIVRPRSLTSTSLESEEAAKER